MMKKTLLATALLGALATPAMAADYVIDHEGQHAFIQFKIKHLGYSWLLGQFNDFDGTFSYDDKNPQASKVSVNINTDSLNSAHAERDKHLKSKDFLDVASFPKASFESTAFTPKADGTAVLTGNFTLHGVTKPISIDVTHIGGGADPWGGYRQGFEGTTSFKLADYGINYDLGPASKEVQIYISLEGVRQ
ncbi:YceI family protein [Gallaecimonas xiamenensis]|uniref:Lipid/polyisoprenoid-binding YceI-like domain-containing protein n=1 Tax=Gallaecimonas xiamenensis 3-C-1 TaxID=745411 RepID=K2IED8_9GAMM|nr:YceI family protein [Gallaecimonas xiamenensis]EKE68411.1 hypothetical protein B3C1_16977 [Gallaecimonas xiamenensis 3-C-1]